MRRAWIVLAALLCWSCVASAQVQGLVQYRSNHWNVGVQVGGGGYYNAPAYYAPTPYVQYGYGASYAPVYGAYNNGWGGCQTVRYVQMCQDTTYWNGYGWITQRNCWWQPG